MPIVSLDELTGRSDRLLSRQGVTFCHITLRPLMLATASTQTSTHSTKGQKADASSCGTSVLYKSVPYLQGAVSLWVQQVKGDGPPSHRVSPFA